MILNQRRGNNMADFIEELDGMNELIYIADIDTYEHCI